MTAKRYYIFALLFLYGCMAIFLSLPELPTLNYNRHSTEMNGKGDTTRISKRIDRKIFVFSMLHETKEKGRYNKFVSGWNMSYPEVEIERYTTAHSGRGFAITFGTFQVLLKAQAQELDYAIILEDDALPFFSHGEFEVRLNQSLQSWPKSSPVLFLGCHHISAKKGLRERSRGVGKLTFAYGAYAYVVRREFYPLMIDFFEGQLEKLSKKLRPLSPDDDWWDIVFRDYEPYVTLPLLVDHTSSYSYSWNRPRNNSWAGNPYWWNVH